MIITTEDTFSRKSKSSVKLTSEISISSSRNDESMKSELHTTESDITSTRGRSRKKLINSTKRSLNIPSSTTDSSSFSLFHHNEEFSSFTEEFKEKSSLHWISVKNSSSHYCKIDKVCNSSKFEPVGDIFENNSTHSNTESENTNCKINYVENIVSKKYGKIHPVERNRNMQPHCCSVKATEELMKQTSRKEFTSIEDEEYSRRNRSAGISGTNYDFDEVHRQGREEIIVFNVHCVENSKKRDKGQSNNSSCNTSCPKKSDMKVNTRNSERTECNDDVIFGCTKENKAKAGKYEENIHQLGSQSMRQKSCTLKDSSIKKKFIKANTARSCSHNFPITKNSENHPTSSNLFADSHYNGCNEDCFGTGSSKLFSNKKPPEVTFSTSEFDISESDFLPFPESNIVETTMKMPNIPQSIQNMNSDFCECCQFSNFVNIHKKCSHRFQDMQIQGIPDNVHENRCFHQKFGSHNQSPSPQLGSFKEPVTFNENTTDNLLKLTENVLKTTLLGNTEDKKAANEEIAINTIPVEKRKRHCTLCRTKDITMSLCRTGTVDEGELSYNSTYEDVDKKIDPNFMKIPNLDFKPQSIEDSKILKLGQINTQDILHKIQEKLPHETMDNPEVIGSQKDFPILSNKRTKPSKTRIPVQSIQNSKHEFCGCYPYLNYVNVDQKYMPRFRNTQNQGIPRKTNEHQHVNPNIESHHLPNSTHNYIFGDCKCKINGFSNEFKEPEKFMEDTNETLLNPNKNNINTKFSENDITAKISTVNEKLVNNIKPLERKKRSCTLCRTGKADEGELSLGLTYEDDVKRKNINTNKKELVTPDTKPLRENRKANRGNESSSYTKPIMETKQSFGYETKNMETVPRTFDIGRNITIQIIPNFASPNACYGAQNVSTSGERIKSPHSEFNEDNSSKFIKNEEGIPQNQLDIHIHKPEENAYNPLHEASSENKATFYTTRDQYEEDRQSNKWWNCSWRRKKYPYPYCRSPNCRITQDCCTRVDETSKEPNCQRVIPRSNNHKINTMKSCSAKPNCSRNTTNRDENMLKYIQRLNKTIIQDLLATPCPSSSVAHIQTCTQDSKKTPLQTCADSTVSSYNVRPLTVNQCCQYESTFKSTNMVEGIKNSPTMNNENKTLYECLKHLTKKISHIENRLESDDEYEKYSHQNVNSCCCCCNRNSNCCCYYPRVKTSPRKPNNNCKSPCTQSRSVEVIHNMKHCGTAISKECLQENVYTNTEVRPKMSKAIIRRKCRHCCRPPCCPCCRPIPCCSCVPEYDKEFFDNNPQITDVQYEDEIPWCHRDHIAYNCQCEHQIQFRQSQFELKRNNYVIMETKDTSTTEEYQSVKSCQCNEAKSEVKSTNTTEHAPIRNDELMKSVTLDLCNLGDKTLSKFGVPSRHYHWSSNNFSPNMPNEIYRFIRTESYHIPITEQIYDPTPCLRPEILSIDNTKNVSQNIELIEIADKLDLPDAAGDINEGSSGKKKKLSAIYEGKYGSEETGHDTFHNEMISVNLGFDPNQKLKFSSEPSFPKCTGSSKLLDKSDSFLKDISLIHHNSNQNSKQQCKDINIDGDKLKNEMFEDDIVLQQKINIRRNKSGAKLINKKNIDSIQLKKGQKSKTVVSVDNSSTYMPKPFTTKTGLMSFIPPYRDSFRSCTQVNKTKQKPPIGSFSRANIKKITLQKPRTSTNILEARNSKTVTGDEEVQKERGNPKSTDKIDNDEIESGEEDFLTNAIQSESRKPEAKINRNFSNTELNSQDQLTENQVIKTVDNSDSIIGKKIDSEKHLKFSEKQIESKTLETETFERRNIHTKNENNNSESPMKFDEIYSFYDKCFKPSNTPKTVMSVPYFKTNVADIIKSLEFRRSSTTKSFLHSLVGSVANSENQTEANLNNFLLDENIKTKNKAPNYEQFFKESSYQNAVQIPQKILSKTDLISLK